MHTVSWTLRWPNKFARIVAACHNVSAHASSFRVYCSNLLQDSCAILKLYATSTPCMDYTACKLESINERTISLMWYNTKMKGLFREKWMDTMDPKKKKKIESCYEKDRAQISYECFCCYSRVEILNITPHLPNTDILSIATPEFEEPGNIYLLRSCFILYCFSKQNLCLCLYDSNYSLTRKPFSFVSFNYLIFSYTVLKS